MNAERKTDVYLGVWLMGGLGLLIYCMWSCVLAFIIGMTVGASNDFWRSGHFGFTVYAAVPVAFGCACVWGYRFFGNATRRLLYAAAFVCASLVAFSCTLQPGLELWFVLADGCLLVAVPLLLFFAMSAAWQLKSSTISDDEPCVSGQASHGKITNRNHVGSGR